MYVMCYVIVCIKYHCILCYYSINLRTRVPMLRLLVILVLGLHLFSDQCNGFAEEGLRELCRKLPNTDPIPTKNCPSMAPSKSATFSCGHCSPSSIDDPYVCKYCYKGTENEAFSCRGCKLGPMAKPVICDDCKTNPGQTSQDSATGCHIQTVNHLRSFMSSCHYTIDFNV